MQDTTQRVIWAATAGRCEASVGRGRPPRDSAEASSFPTSNILVTAPHICITIRDNESPLHHSAPARAAEVFHSAVMT